MSFTATLFGLFLSIALLMLALAVITGVLAGRAQAGEVRTLGFVTALTARTDAEGSVFYYPVVTITLPDGRRTTVQSTTGGWPSAYKVDDAVTIVYDAARPTGARISAPDDWLMYWLWTLCNQTRHAALTLGTAGKLAGLPRRRVVGSVKPGSPLDMI